VKKAEEALAADKAAVARERAALEEETVRLRAELERVERERTEVVAHLSPTLLATYDTLIHGRRGLAVVEARDQLCTACHVRLRPQVFNEIRRGDAIHQCGSCQRILYFVHGREAAPTAAAPGAEQ
jgi:predicted  nucleic acid-binding Zn-ribbon protein